MLLLIRDDETATGDSTTSSVAGTTATTSDSTVAVPTSSTVFTEGPPAGGTVVVPDGALDLGDGVYLPIDAAVELTGDDPYTLTNSTSASTMIVQVVRREPGEDPNVLLQEYIDIFDGDYTLVSYLPSETQPPGVDGHDTLRFSRVAYMLYQPELEYPNVVGEVAMWMRNDGLTILADTYGSSASPISDGAFDAMIDSLAAAPSLGAPAEWFPAKSTMPDTVHQGADLPFNRARRLLLPAGFQVSARSDFSITASNGDDTVSVAATLQVGDRAAAHGIATELLTGQYTAVGVGSFVPTGSGQLTFDKASWSGTDGDGAAVTGEVWLQFDDVSQTVVVVVIAHRTAEWDANEMVMMVASVAGSGPAAAGSAGGA
ncbi:MAG: hypothetical protein Q8M22_19230 [Actinomycetota bacterium]|nr:hypothetical protein [Actinomycetota bacterium]